MCGDTMNLPTLFAKRATQAQWSIKIRADIADRWIWAYYEGEDTIDKADRHIPYKTSNG